MYPRRENNASIIKDGASAPSFFYLDKIAKILYNNGGGDRMRLFRSKAEKELDMLVFELQQNLENNYKSVAQEYRKKLGERVEELRAEGKLDEKVHAK